MQVIEGAFGIAASWSFSSFSPRCVSLLKLLQVVAIFMTLAFLKCLTSVPTSLRVALHVARCGKIGAPHIPDGAD